MLEPHIRTTVKDRGEAAILRELSKVGAEASVTVGYHAKYVIDPIIPTIARVHEYGFEPRNIPARPTMEPSMVKNADKHVLQTWRHLRKLYTSKGVGMNLETMLKTQGERAVIWLRTEIRKRRSPRLDPKYARRKRRMGYGNNPLIAMRVMVNSVTWEPHIRPGGISKPAAMMRQIERELKNLKVGR